MKKIAALLAIAVMTVSLAGCGSRNETENQQTEEASAKLTGTCAEILTQVYEQAELSDDFREAMEYYEMAEIPEDAKEYLLGTADVDYVDSVYSVPMMNAVAYQCILLRVSENQDVEEAKQILADSADPAKWVCVEAESVVVENVGDVILFLMCDSEKADAIKEAFMNL